MYKYLLDDTSYTPFVGVSVRFTARMPSNIYSRSGAKMVGLGLSSIFENGISGVGCSQFFASYSAYGGDSIMWNVYAKRVLGLVFFGDLCSTLPWIMTRSPGSQSSFSRALP